MRTPPTYWIKTLDMQPHPEGGYYSESYRAEESIAAEALPDRYQSERSFATAIYFLLVGEQVSRLHRLASDEMWHFYEGTTLTVHLLTPTGEYQAIKLGREPHKGERFQFLVPAGYWFGASVDNSEGYALVGCTVAPGFDFADFELADGPTLLTDYPQHEALIQWLAI